MALALRFDELTRWGQVRDYAELARIGGVTSARITPIMALTLLAPDIQEELLFYLDTLLHSAYHYPKNPLGLT